jgi:hypothetical protein
MSSAKTLKEPLAKLQLPDGFVLVRKDPDAKDVEPAPAEGEKAQALAEFKKQLKMLSAGVHSAMSHLRAGKKGKGGKLATYRTKLSYYNITSSGVGAASAPVIRVRPSDSSEFASFANLFDEYICHGVEIHFQLYFSGTVLAQVVPLTAALAYDPMSNGTYGSVEGVIVASQRIGPLAMKESYTNPGPVSRSGFWIKRFKCPTGPQGVDFATSSVATGQWQETSTTAADYGYIKGYITAPTGGAMVVNLPYFLVYDMEFRSRS